MKTIKSWSSSQALAFILLRSLSLAIPTSQSANHSLFLRATTPDPPSTRNIAEICSSAESKSLFGDTSFNEPVDNSPALLCARGSGESATTCFDPSTSNKPSDIIPVWVSSDGGQVDYLRLYESDRTALWNAMGTTGRKLEAKLNHYVGRRVSRLDEDKSAQNAIFAENYRELVDDRKTNYNVGEELIEFIDLLEQAGLGHLPIDAENGEYTRVEYKPRVEQYLFPVVALAASPKNNMIVSIYSAAWCDTNEKPRRAYSSTITWNAWRRIAGSAEAARKLKYSVRFQVVNVAANNVMSMAHERFPGNVDQMLEGGGRSLGPITGHGRWTAADEAWAYLLAAPNLKTVVEMLIDYNTEMDNPYPTIIHTFPLINKKTSPRASEGDYRAAGIVIEFGPPPMETVASSDTVEAS